MTDQTTRETTEVRTAGRELDALVAEKVFGWEYHEDDGTWRKAGEFRCLEEELPFFSVGLSAAWEVVEAMGGWCNLTRFSTGEWRAAFKLHGVARSAEASAAPLAICLAALQVVEVTRD